MKRNLYSLLVLAAGLALIAQATPAQNLFTPNPGFDETAPATVTVTGTDGTSVAGWQFRDTVGGQCEFSVKAEATAPTAPNVFEWKILSGLNTTWSFDRNLAPAEVEAGKAYRYGIWARNLTGGTRTFKYQVFSISKAAEATFMDITPGGDWEKFEDYVTAPFGGADIQLRMYGRQSDPCTIQFDEAFLIEEEGLGNLWINGGFESSDSKAMQWNLIKNGDSDFVGQVVSDAAEGANALKISRTNATGEGMLQSNPYIPWKGSNTAIVTLRMKNLPDIASDDGLQMRIAAYTDTKAIISGHDIGSGFALAPADGEFHYFEYNVDVLPSNTAYLRFAFRIYNASLAATSGDLILDDFRLGDLTAGTTVPVELSSFEVE